MPRLDIRIVALVALSVVLLAGVGVFAVYPACCGDDDGPDAGPSATAAANAEPIDVPEAGGSQPLAAGRAYASARFQPPAGFSVDDGWSASLDTRQMLALFRGEDAGANCLCIISPDGVFDPASGARQPLPGDLADWLAANPGLSTSKPSSLQVDDIGGKQLEAQVADDRAGFPDAEFALIGAGDRQFGLRPGEKAHIIVLDYHDAPLVIAVRAPADEFGDYFRHVEAVVGSLSFPR